PATTTWVWDLHADAHDFDSHTTDLEDISRKVFSAHFGQLGVIFIWLSGMYFHGARFSNYEAWLSDPTHIKPSAQVVWPIVGQEILNGDVGGGFQGVQITSGFFQLWRGSGITSELQLYSTAIGALICAGLMFFAGWWHYHKAAPKLEWFQNVESMMNHHLAGLLGLGSLAWADPKEIPLPHEFMLNRALMAELYPSFAKGLTPFFTFNWTEYSDFLTFRGGLNPVSMPPYPYLATDYGTQLSLFTHHMWIGGFCICGAAAHAAIFMVRDYDPATTTTMFLIVVLRHRDAIISHLNWVCIFLGFHSFWTLYPQRYNECAWTSAGHVLRHSNSTSAIFAHLCSTHMPLHLNSCTYSAGSTSASWGGDIVAVGGKIAMMPISLGTSDFMVHHIHAFTIHVTVLILLKDKANLGFDSLVTDQDVEELVNWKMQSDVWGSVTGNGVSHITGGNFAQSANTINGWLRDFLWAQSSQVIQSYGSALSAYGLIFLGAHFIWAFSLMFLFSGRGYWQELIESIVWAHNKLKVAPAIQPRALSITQGRAVGVAHYLLGGIATTCRINARRIYTYMATKFPKFSQGLASDPTTRRIWFGIATAHDFETHDGMTEEKLYQKIFASHFGQLAIIFLWTSAVEAFTRGGASAPVNIAYSGVYQWWYTIGMRTNVDLYNGSLFLLFVAGLFLFAGWLHLQPTFAPAVSWFKNAESRLNHHLSGLFGVSSLAWTESRYSWTHLRTSEGAGTAILTFLGGFHPQTQSLWLTDMAHHHLAIAVVFIIAGHQYRTNFGIGHSMKEILEAHTAPSGRLGAGHTGLFDTVNNSLHFQLGLALASVGVLCSLTAQHMYSMPPYAFLAQDFTTQAALYSHHQYIAGFIMCGAFAHGAIFFIRDYDPEANKGNWVSLFLGFHTLGLYVHNDVMQAFGTPEKQILIEPVFAQWIQAAQGDNAATAAGNSIYLPGWLAGINSSTNSLFLPIGPGDFLVHHAIALGLHTTTLILVKGALDARGSKLMPDKKDFGYSFPCDGPGRGGTCDISAWDAFYLAVFWELNTVSWTVFYFHWKHLALWQGNSAQFDESSTYIMGWLRDYLWLNSSQLINGYNPFGMNSLSVWAWMFLFGHLIYATGFMFLISWRGYWQELIELLFGHMSVLHLQTL
ncbi:hypothetical protein BE221DRAFT_173593, partial [Ostreococcus tauri]